MSRALQNILRKHHKKVKFTHRKSALLMTLANDAHKDVAALLQEWMRTDFNTKVNRSSSR
jgi:hypothetical protein